MLEKIVATLKGLRGVAVNKRRRNSLRVAKNLLRDSLNPGFQSKPWAGIGERFQRYSFPLSPLKNDYHFDFLCKAAPPDLVDPNKLTIQIITA
jgi:hypothetical protein